MFRCLPLLLLLMLPCLMGADIPSSPMHAVTAQVPDLTLHEIEVLLFNETNEARRRQGMEPYVMVSWLQESARAHCQWMTKNGNMSHTGAAVAENIAAGQRTPWGVVHSTWMHSSGHRANILGGYKYCGVAAYRMTEGGTIYWCQQFSNSATKGSSSADSSGGSRGRRRGRR